MKTLVTALSITTVGFAGSTLYFASRLHEARSRVMLEPPQVAAPAGTAGTAGTASTVRVASQAVDQQASDSSAKPLEDSVARRKDVRGARSQGLSWEERSRKVQQQISAAFMRRYDDPRQRAEMLAEEKAQVRRAFRPYADLTGMSEVELQAFVNLLAEQRLERSVGEHRCGMSDSCDYDAYRFPDVDRQIAEITALIGADRYQQYGRFREAAIERRVVEHLRVKLVDVDALRSADAERLISALYEERERFFSQAKLKGVYLTTMGTGFGMVVARTDEQGSEGEIDEHSREFNELARTRAATILTPEQLRVFNAIQDEAYRSVEGSLQRQREIEAARAAQAQSDARAPPRQGAVAR